MKTKNNEYTLLKNLVEIKPNITALEIGIILGFVGTNEQIINKVLCLIKESRK